MKLNQPAYAATGLVPGGRIAHQEACCRSWVNTCDHVCKGLKDHPRHAEAVSTSFAPSVNFEILDMVEGGDWGRGVLAVNRNLWRQIFSGIDHRHLELFRQPSDADTG